MKKFFAKIVGFLRILFGGQLNAWIHDHVQPSIEFVQRIKAILESPVVDVITAIIPSDLDDKIRAVMLNHCSKALQLLSVTSEIANEPDAAKQIAMFIEYLKQCTPALRAALYKQFASEMAKLSGGTNNVKGHSVDLLTQLQYSKLVEGLTHEDIPDETPVQTPTTGADNSQEVRTPEPVEVPAGNA